MHLCILYNRYKSMIPVLFCNGLLRKSLFFFERDETNDDGRKDFLHVPFGLNAFLPKLAEVVIGYIEEL